MQATVWVAAVHRHRPWAVATAMILLLRRSAPGMHAASSGGACRWHRRQCRRPKGAVGRRPSFEEAGSQGTVGGQAQRVRARPPPGPPAVLKGRVARFLRHAPRGPTAALGAGGRASLSAAAPPSRSHRLAVHSTIRHRPWSEAAELFHSSQHLLCVGCHSHEQGTSAWMGATRSSWRTG